MKVVNDCAEHSIARLTNLKSNITKTIEQKDSILSV